MTGDVNLCILIHIINLFENYVLLGDIKEMLINSSLRGAVFSREQSVAGRGNPEFVYYQWTELPRFARNDSIGKLTVFP
jgi:hypothetical protein